MMFLYTIVFDDDSIFKGGDLQNTKWLEIPDKKIRSIFYSLPIENILCLTNFKRIYHYIEVTEDIIGDKKGIVNLECSHLLIERNNEIIHYKIDLKNSNILVEMLNINDKYILGLNPIGWK